MTFGKRLLGLLAGLFLLLPAGCETVPMEASDNFVGDMVVVTEYASFFRLGPQQAGGADRSLRTGERVMLLRKEFGYSRVQLEDDQVGYMANEDIQPAPPEPRRKAGKGKPGAAGGGRAYEDDNYSDIPVVADPSLDIMPEDVPIEPLPDLLPEPVDTPAPTPSPSPEATPEPAPSPSPAAG